MKHNVPPPDLYQERRVGENAITHRVKCWSKNFNYSWITTPSASIQHVETIAYWKILNEMWKPFEVRRLDRDYRQGDTFIMYEFRPEDETFSGRRMEGRIRDVLSNIPGIEADYGIILIKFYAHISHFPEANT